MMRVHSYTFVVILNKSIKKNKGIELRKKFKLVDATFYNGHLVHRHSGYLVQSQAE